jgi:hypothetical protein
VCGVCPSLAMELGAFDVAPRPSAESAYAREHGYRVDRVTGVPVCVHPDRVGLEPARYASEEVPLPWEGEPAGPPELPEGPGGLDAWLISYLGSVPEPLFDQALTEAHDAALARFSPGAVVEAMRRVLSSGQLG